MRSFLSCLILLGIIACLQAASIGDYQQKKTMLRHLFKYKRGTLQGYDENHEKKKWRQALIDSQCISKGHGISDILEVKTTKDHGYHIIKYTRGLCVEMMVNPGPNCHVYKPDETRTHITTDSGNPCMDVRSIS